MSAADAIRWLLRHGNKAGQVRRAYRAAFADGRDKLIMADLADLCHARTTTFAPGDPQLTAFREGQRSVLLHIADVLGIRAADLMQAQPRSEEDDE